MEESTLTVLRTVKGIQFDGRPDPRKIEIGLCGASAKSKLNPVPYVAIAAELWGTGIDIHRELGLLITAKCLDLIEYRGMQGAHFTRPDGKLIVVDYETEDGDSGHTFYFARCDGREWKRNANMALQRRDGTRPSKEDGYNRFTECYAMRDAGLDALAKNTSRDPKESAEQSTNPGAITTEKIAPIPPPAHRRAAESYEWACAKNPSLATSPLTNAYEYIRDNGCPQYNDKDPLPEVGTWKRYRRGGDQDYSQQPAGPGNGRSIVKSKDL